MKLLSLCLCFLSALPLFAGKRIQMESTDLAAKTTEQDELLLDATRFRMNSGKTSAIFLTDGGRSRMLVLDKSRNEYMEIDQQTMDQMGQAMQGLAAQMEAAMKGMTPEQRAMMEQALKGKLPQAAAPAPTTTYTAKGRGTANGIACTNYEGIRAGQKVSEVCTAQPGDLKLGAADFEVFQKMQGFMGGMQRALQNSPFASVVNSRLADNGISGFPIKGTTFQNGQATHEDALKSITEITFADADFSVGNAKKTEMPDMSALTGAGKGKAKAKGK